MRISNALALLAALSLAACATQPEKIEAAYVSPTKYSGLSCAQLTEERNRLVGQVNELTGQQKEKATNDAVAMGVGLVLFWPALFILAAGDDQKEELARLKGEYDAVNELGSQKGCFKA